MNKTEKLIRSKYSGYELRKKISELKILNNIYNDDKVMINVTEKPDFIITGINEKFGVEITDYYYNESSARLKNKPGYLEGIINSDDSSIITQRDKDKITKQAIYIKDPYDDKFKFLLDVVGLRYNDHYNYNDVPAYEDVEKQLINIIKEKDSKSNAYQKLDYYELFIQDRENYFAKDDSRRLSLINSQALLDIIEKSNYKRVYIFSEKDLYIIGDKMNKNLIKYGMFKEKYNIVSNKGDENYE